MGVKADKLLARLAVEDGLMTSGEIEGYFELPESERDAQNLYKRMEAEGKLSPDQLKDLKARWKEEMNARIARAREKAARKAESKRAALPGLEGGGDEAGSGVANSAVSGRGLPAGAGLPAPVGPNPDPPGASSGPPAIPLAAIAGGLILLLGLGGVVLWLAVLRPSLARDGQLRAIRAALAAGRRDDAARGLKALGDAGDPVIAGLRAELEAQTSEALAKRVEAIRELFAAGKLDEATTRLTELEASFDGPTVARLRAAVPLVRACIQARELSDKGRYGEALALVEDKDLSDLPVALSAIPAGLRRQRDELVARRIDEALTQVEGGRVKDARALLEDAAEVGGDAWRARIEDARRDIERIAGEIALGDKARSLLSEGKLTEAWSVLSKVPDGPGPLGRLKASVARPLRLAMLRGVERLAAKGKRKDALALLDRIESGGYGLRFVEYELMKPRIEEQARRAADVGKAREEWAALAGELDTLQGHRREGRLEEAASLLRGWSYQTSPAKARVELEFRVQAELMSLISAAIARLQAVAGDEIALEFRQGGTRTLTLARIDGPARRFVETVGGGEAQHSLFELTWSQLEQLASAREKDALAAARRRAALAFVLGRHDDAREALATAGGALAAAMRPWLESGNNAGAASVSSVTSVVEDDGRGWKTTLVDLQRRWKGASKSAREGLGRELDAVLTEALGLVGESAALAYDVTRFLGERTRFLKRAGREEAWMNLCRTAFRVLKAALTGPSSIARLGRWCKARWKPGLEALREELALLRPPAKVGKAYQRESQLRVRQQAVREAVEDLMARLRAENLAALEGLLAELDSGGAGGAVLESEFAALVDRLVRTVGGDPRRAAELLSRFREIEGEADKAALAKARAAMARLRDKAEDRLLDATQKAIKSREPGVGFDLLQAALLIKPNSDRAWRGLKHVKVEGEWLRPRDAELRRKGLRYDAAIGWHKGDKKPGQYFDLKLGWKPLGPADAVHSNPDSPWILPSEHFVLHSTASLKRTLEIQRRLEAFYLQLFRQLDRFFAPNGEALVVFGLKPRPPLKVWFYRDAEQFHSHGKPSTPWSAGFYAPSRKTSFFYERSGVIDTLQHEIVHQILAESSRAAAEAPWLVEGIAVFMQYAELDKDGRLTLGRIDQNARPMAFYRKVQAGRATRRLPDILGLTDPRAWSAASTEEARLNYESVGALVYFLMNFDDGTYRGSFLDLLRDRYNGARASLTEYLGLREAALGEFFRRFYRSGFVRVNGILMTREEAMRLEEERVARLYPDP